MNNRITKEIAADVAAQLTKSKYEEIENLRIELGEYAYGIFKSTIPKEVFELYEKYPKYFETTGYLNLSGNGFAWESVHFKKDRRLPYNKKQYTPTNEEAKYIRKTLDDINDKRHATDRLKTEIETALYSLRTYSNIEKEFPEAFKLLPERITTSLAININDIRSKL